jgi:hypothetical protein
MSQAAGHRLQVAGHRVKASGIKLQVTSDKTAYRGNSEIEQGFGKAG